MYIRLKCSALVVFITGFSCNVMQCNVNVNFLQGAQKSTVTRCRCPQQNGCVFSQ